MTDERNFRSSYYEKVGFRSVEEKRSLEILLKELLLDVIPVYIESHDFIINQRKAEFCDLQKALKVTKILDEYTKPYLMFLTMWLLRTRRAKLDMSTQLETPLHRAMSRMAETLWHIVDIDSYEEKLVDTYWILCGLLDQVQKFHKEVSRLQECTCTLLEREDPELYKHLVKIEAIHNIPYDIWFCSCFAGTISNGSIAKIWDKIALTEETSEVIVNKAIESWQQSGSTLTTISQTV
ncbi:TBC1 domain family member 7 [Eufriesea mexicana]|nr:TBC1 domain family member 7 [Eufriesea mexicana]